MRISAHRIEVTLPDGWEGRIYRRHGGDPTLHAATFALPANDGDFGSEATARMPPGGAFLVLTEYRPGGGLVPGEGLFAARTIPHPLVPRHFHPRALLVGRRGQAGTQHFFTAGTRPFCLYAVVSAPRGARAAAARGPRLEELNRLIGSVRITPSPAATPSR